MTNFAQEQERIKKGCGIEVKHYSAYKWYSKKYVIMFCDGGYLCDNCQAKKDQLQKDKKMVEEAIERIENKTYERTVSEDWDLSGYSIDDIWESAREHFKKELKKELFGEKHDL